METISIKETDCKGIYNIYYKGKTDDLEYTYKTKKQIYTSDYSHRFLIEKIYHLPCSELPDNIQFESRIRNQFISGLVDSISFLKQKNEITITFLMSNDFDFSKNHIWNPCTFMIFLNKALTKKGVKPKSSSFPMMMNIIVWVYW